MAAAGLLAMSPRATAGAEKRTITFWNLFTSGVQNETIAELVNRFNKSNAGYSVRRIDIPYGQLHQKMLAAIAGEVPPDVSVFDRFQVASYAARNAFLPLDEMLRRDGIRGQEFFDAPWAECFYDGRQFAVPYDTDVRVLYYNKALFRAAGLDPDRPPRTWSELREYSRKLTKRRGDGRLNQVGYLPIYGNTTLYLYGWQKGGSCRRMAGVSCSTIRRTSRPWPGSRSSPTSWAWRT
jgi:ABC-type glycerol-3-phosphate transport system substrate-binding protein